jgi:hypothetical protein
VFFTFNRIHRLLYIPEHHQRAEADGEEGDHRDQVLLSPLFLSNVQFSFVEIAVAGALAVSVAVLVTAPEIEALVR